jgi:hypothetical protein
LDAWYLSVPPEKNAALVYTNAFGLLTNSSGLITNFMGKAWLPAIGQGLSDGERRQLKTVLADQQPALRLLYSAPVSGRSRYPLRLEQGFNMQLPYLEKIRPAVSLLAAEALLHATDGDAEKAARAFLAAGHVADSLSEEPIMASQMVRYAAWGTVLSRLERALSLTAFTGAQLASLQQVVEAAERPRAAARALAGEQACGVSFLTEREVMEGLLKQAGNSKNPLDRFGLGFGVSLLRVSGLLEGDKVFFCREMGRHLTALELPYPARFAACQQFAATPNVPKPYYLLSRGVLPALARVHIREAEHVALVRVAAAALAIERFRLAHTNALPENLQQLVPAFCKAVPADPIDRKPLRYKTHGGSYAVYSIGSDGQDDGGVAWDSNYTKVPQDVSFVVKH